MNIDLLFAIIFYGILILFFYKHKENVKLQGKIIALYRTTWGLKLMERIAKSCPRLLRVLGTLGTISGFVGMGFIFYWLVKGTFELLLVPEALPAVAPVLPGIKVIPGLPVLSFWHWIIAIFCVAAVHEFSHGIFARLYNTRVKSSGIALFGPILGAFVEPDENELARKKRSVQLAVFAAGPFSNMVLGALFLLIMNVVTGPVYAAMYEGDGLIVNEVLQGYPAYALVDKVPFTIKGINGESASNVSLFFDQTSRIKPGDVVVLNTDKGEFSLASVQNPDNASKAFIGIAGLELNKKVKEDVVKRFGSALPSAFSWVHMLVFWLVVVNVGVGLFNLLPLGPVDGGRMFLTGCMGIFKPKRAKQIWSFVTFLCLLLIFVNLVPYLWKLLIFLAKPLFFVIGL